MNDCRRLLSCGLLAGLMLFTLPSQGGVPAAEILLPEDTLAVFTTADFSKLAELTSNTSQAKLWNDPAMKPFREKFLTKWSEEFVKPLERELGVQLADYTALLQGQVTFALTQNGWKGGKDETPGVLLLVDAKDKGEQLKKNLADLRTKWVAAGKSLKTEKIRDVEFVVLPLSSNDVPKTLRKLFPRKSEVRELGDEEPATKTPPKNELVLGQADSLLVIANSTKAAEAVVARLKGGSVPALGEYAPYQANHLASFRGAPLYGWANMKRLMDVLVPVWSAKKENPEAPNPFDVQPEKVLNALGLSSLKTIAMTFRESNEGSLFEMFFGVPEANRQGIFKILAGEPKEAKPPPFVPADALKFQRWRMDGRKAWATLEQALSSLSPQAGNTLNFILDSANTYAKDKDPGFDIRKNLIGNLGDDLITIEKRPRGDKADPAASQLSLVLVGSPNPEQFAAALKSILVFLSQGASTSPQEREFLGRKILSVPLSLPGRPAPAGGKTPSLHYAATSGYLALSTDSAMVEEHLRACDATPKGLRDVAGLTEAAQKVTDPGSSLFGYENDLETMRSTLEMLRNISRSDAGSGSNANLLPLLAGAGGAEKIFKEWLDFSLLPEFEKVSKYFHFSVYGGSATVDGLTLKMFTPAPPGLK